MGSFQSEGRSTMDKQPGEETLPNRNELNKIKNLIENSFMHDWAIRIEYADKSQQQGSQWLKWNKTIFAINDSTPVMQDIVECCRNHPDCSMKLICEHYNPYYRFIYCIKLQNNPRNALAESSALSTA